jgi:ABC-2 type transport system ATP-binding protein
MSAPAAGTPDPILEVRGLSKTYAGGVRALHPLDLDVRRGEIFALLGPNGAGKTTLIGMLCGLVTPSSGTVRVDGCDIVTDYRRARAQIGLVPQELATHAFERVYDTVAFSRGLFGQRADPQGIERLLRQLALWDKRDARIMTLSGGMKRRVMIAKALAHEPRLLFLDEPSAGVDVDLRRGMWELVRELREAGVTIILTTHYLQEAEDMADRIGVIRQGRLVLVEEKASLMRRLGRRRVGLRLAAPLAALPRALQDSGLALAPEGNELVWEIDTEADAARVPALLQQIAAQGLVLADIETRRSTLEEIFVKLVAQEPA